jgi:hypothetical protein
VVATAQCLRPKVSTSPSSSAVHSSKQIRPSGRICYLAAADDAPTGTGAAWAGVWARPPETHCEAVSDTRL